MTDYSADDASANRSNLQASDVSCEEVNPSALGSVNPPGSFVDSGLTVSPPPLTVFQAAQAMQAAGLNVVPVRENGSKTPELASWRKYEKQRTTGEQVWSWFGSNQATGVGVIYGEISGNTELIEFEGRAMAEGVFEDVAEVMKGSGLGEVWDAVCTGWVGQSPSGGLHLRVRVSDGKVPGNTKLASRPARDDELTADQQRVRRDNPDKVFQTPLIETRGEGGFGVCEPSHGRVHPSGKPYLALSGGPHTIPVVDSETLRTIHDVLRMADQMPKQAAPEWRGRPPKIAEGALRPGDDFNVRGDMGLLMSSHGWTYVYSRSGTDYWRRPGKNVGISASINYKGCGKLYVFTSSTEFDNEKAYSPFAAYAILNHGGKYADAARDLARQGYGDQLVAEVPVVPVPRIEHGPADEDMWAGINEDGMDEPPPSTAAAGSGSGERGGGSDRGEGPGGNGTFSSPDAPMRVARELEPLWLKEDGRTLHHWRDTWMSWTGTRYTEVGVSALKSRLYLRLEHALYYTTNKDGELVPKPWNPAIKKIANLVESVAAVTHLDEKIESGTWVDKRSEGGLISCANTLVHPITRKTQPHSPAYFTTTAVPYDYAPEAQCAEWVAFLNQVFPGDQESVDALQEWFGYVISGRTDLQKGFQLIGPPRAGKGTVARILGRLIGNENAVGSTLKGLGTNFGLQPLVGKALCIVGDAHMENRNQSEIVTRLLMITGEDPMSIDRKNRAAWEGKLGTRVMILANKAPRFADTAGAIVNRWITLNFTESFLGREDPTLEERLTKELAGIFNWALDGMVRLNKRNRFVQPGSSRMIIDSQMEAASPTRAFIGEKCVLGSDQWVTKEALFAHWQSWCYQNNQKNVGTTAAFASDLYASVAGVGKTRKRVSGVLTYVFTGITLRVQPGTLTPANQSTHPPQVEEPEPEPEPEPTVPDPQPSFEDMIEAAQVQTSAPQGHGPQEPVRQQSDGLPGWVPSQAEPPEVEPPSRT